MGSKYYACVTCKKPFTRFDRVDKKFCTGRCRTQAYRVRKTSKGVTVSSP